MMLEQEDVKLSWSTPQITELELRMTEVSPKKENGNDSINGQGEGLGAPS